MATRLSGYQRSIVKATHCTPEDAEQIETLMRTVIFHSTLDWLDRKQFDQGARDAQEVLTELRREDPSYVAL